MKAFILAAGLGTRLKPITESIPKALVKLNGVPLLEILIKKLMNAGINEIIINTHHFADQISDYLATQSNFGIKIIISDESKKLLDTGGGLKKVGRFFNDGQPFFVHNIDIYSGIDLMSLYRYHFRSEALMTLAVQQRESSRYLLFDKEKKLCGWKNRKTNESIMVRTPKGGITEFAYSGIHIADPKIFFLMPDKEVFSLVDLFLSIAAHYIITYFEHNETTFFDLGKPENLRKAEELLRED